MENLISEKGSYRFLALFAQKLLSRPPGSLPPCEASRELRGGANLFPQPAADLVQGLRGVVDLPARQDQVNVPAVPGGRRYVLARDRGRRGGACVWVREIVCVCVRVGADAGCELPCHPPPPLGSH